MLYAFRVARPFSDWRYCAALARLLLDTSGLLDLQRLGRSEERLNLRPSLGVVIDLDIDVPSADGREVSRGLGRAGQPELELDRGQDALQVGVGAGLLVARHVAG